jgi:hypothetical protein
MCLVQGLVKLDELISAEGEQPGAGPPGAGPPGANFPEGDVVEGENNGHNDEEDALQMIAKPVKRGAGVFLLILFSANRGMWYSTSVHSTGASNDSVRLRYTQILSPSGGSVSKQVEELGGVEGYLDKAW